MVRVEEDMAVMVETAPDLLITEEAVEVADTAAPEAPQLDLAEVAAADMVPTVVVVRAL